MIKQLKTTQHLIDKTTAKMVELTTIVVIEKEESFASWILKAL